MVLFSVSDCAFHPVLQKILIAEERGALVDERKGHSPPARQEAADLHQGHQKYDPSFLQDGKIQGLESIGFFQDPGPGGRMKKGMVPALQQEGVPIRIFERIENLNIHADSAFKISSVLNDRFHTANKSIIGNLLYLVKSGFQAAA
jgi:hypothetical protein